MLEKKSKSLVKMYPYCRDPKPMGCPRGNTIGKPSLSDRHLRLSKKISKHLISIKNKNKKPIVKLS